MKIYIPKPGDPIVPDDDDSEDEGDESTDDDPGPETSISDFDLPTEGDATPIDDETVVAERVQYYGEGGKLITESLKDYTRKTVLANFASLDTFLQRWSSTEKKAAVLTELQEQGVFLGELAEQVGKDFDAFDLICHVAFDQPPLTRRERADNVKKRNYFAKYGEQARAVLEALLEKYADEGIEPIETIDILNVQPPNAFGTPVEIIRLFGSKDRYLAALQDLEAALYAQAQ